MNWDKLIRVIDKLPKSMLPALYGCVCERVADAEVFSPGKMAEIADRKQSSILVDKRVNFDSLSSNIEYVIAQRVLDEYYSDIIKTQSRWNFAEWLYVRLNPNKLDSI